MALTQLTPITELRILRGVPFAPDYNNLMDFASATEQSNYFSSLTAYSYTEVAPIRQNNVIRIPLTADSLIDCNYVMYKNANFKNKWFYAFITNVEFVNINLSYITVEIDIWQTWQFNYNFKTSFIVRAMEENDVIGSNLQPEKFELGQYVINNKINTLPNFNGWKVVVASSSEYDGQWQIAQGSFYSNIYSGLAYQIFDSASEINTFLEKVTDDNKVESIVAIFQVPAWIVSQQSSNTPASVNIAFTPGDKLNGYTPKNKKLLTYPFSYVLADNLEGNTAVFRREYFSNVNLALGFTLIGELSPNPILSLFPRNYKGVDNNYSEQITLSNFPQCAYTIDSYRAWLAQNSGQLALQTGMQIGAATVGVALAPFTGGASLAVTAGSAVSVTNAIANAASQLYSASIQPPQSRGNQVGNIMTSLSQKGIWLYDVSITYEYAKIIDDYFTMFGYAQNKVAIPKIRTRPYWDYLELKNAQILGNKIASQNVPADDLGKIRAIFEKGVTIWHTSDVGNYNNNNEG